MQLSRRDLVIAIVVSLLVQLVAIGVVLRWLPGTSPAPLVAQARDVAAAQAVAEVIQVHVDGELHVVYPPTDTPAPTMTPLPATATPVPTSTMPPTPTPIVWPTDTPVATATPAASKPAHWAPFLDVLGVQLMRRPEAQYELIEAWAIVNGSWEPNQELGFPGVPQWAWDEWVTYHLGGDTHVYGIVLDRNGNPRTDVPFVHWWGPGGADGAEFRAEANGWCNSKLGASGQPQGQYAPRHWFPQGGEKLTNIWLPYNRHVTVFGVWKARW